MTNLSFHIRSSYATLPEVNILSAIGLCWAFITAIPSLMALNVNKQNFLETILIGGMLSLLSLVFFIPINVGLIILLSLE